MGTFPSTESSLFHTKKGLEKVAIFCVSDWQLVKSSGRLFDHNKICQLDSVDTTNALLLQVLCCVFHFILFASWRLMRAVGAAQSANSCGNSFLLKISRISHPTNISILCPNKNPLGHNMIKRLIKMNRLTRHLLSVHYHLQKSNIIFHLMDERGYKNSTRENKICLCL